MKRSVKALVEAPSVFVGHSGYPNVNIGVLSTPHDKHHDNPYYWASKNFTIPSVSGLRRQLTNLTKTSHIKEKSDLKDLALAKVAPLVEATYVGMGGPVLTPQQEAIPYGPRASLQSLNPIENIKSNPLLEKYADDIDATATTALHELFAKGVTEHALTKMLSVGNLGRGTARKLVPTKWSITAVDDSLSKHLRADLVGFDTLHPKVHMGGYLGNYFVVLFFDGPFSFEFMEILPESKTIMSDWESPLGRKEYAKQTAGAYYATKLAIVEYLRAQKKQATVIAIRFITDEYYQSLGVWVVREACRKALGEMGIEFEDKVLQCAFAQKYAKQKFDIDLDLMQSPVLKQLSGQSTLSSFI